MINVTFIDDELATSPNSHQIKTQYVSDETSQLFMFVNYVNLGVIISILGIFTNSINIAVFRKLGFKDTINITLTGLAVSDLLSLVFLMWRGVCLNPQLQELDLPFVPQDVQFLLGGWPFIYFSRVTSWITAFVTLERCLCIARPLTVRRIITPRRNTIIILLIFLVIAATIAPVYYSNRLGWKFSEKTNRTLLSLIQPDNAKEVDEISFLINSISSSIFSFCIVAVCTAILTLKLNKKTDARKGLTTSAKTSGNVAELRDNRLVKRIIILSSIFILTYTPPTVFFVAVVFEPELRIDGEYRNLSIVYFSCSYVLVAVNSSTNIFVYLAMSSKYRLAFYEMFGIQLELK